MIGLLGDVWRITHWLAIRHVTCPHDGTLVHERGHEHAAEAGEVVRANSSLRDVSALLGAAHEHEGCDESDAVPRPIGVELTERASSQAVRRENPEPLDPGKPGARRDVLAYAPRLPPPG